MLTMLAWGAVVLMILAAAMLLVAGLVMSVPLVPGAMLMEVRGPLPTSLLKVKSRMLNAAFSVVASAPTAVWVLVEKITLLLMPGVAFALVPLIVVAKLESRLPLKPAQLVFTAPPQYTAPGAKAAVVRRTKVGSVERE